MKFSIRPKLVVLFTVVALLPLVAAILTISIGGGRLQSESVGRSIQSVAVSEALLLRLSLTKDIEKLLLDLNGPVVRSALAGGGPRLSDRELAELDAAWATMPLSDRRISGVLSNAVAEELARVRRQDPRLVEILVTDRHGQLVAATGRTSDFYQGDEDWWRTVAGDGRERICVPPIGYDRSTGVWSVDLCVPIASDGGLYGVAKAVLDVSRWIRGPRVSVGRLEASVMFVRDDGRIIYREKTVPLTARAGEWHGPIATSAAPGRRVTESGQIQAYSPVSLPDRIGSYPVTAPKWSLVLFLPEAQALGAVTRLSIAVLAIGLAVILIIFLAGLFLVDRMVVRRVHRLQRAVRDVAEGDLDRRIERRRGRRGRTGGDEIDELADGFNDMVGRIQRSHEELTAANELKMNFIRVAGHELRTPVSYMLGMVHLMEDSRDPQRLCQALRSMGAKAERLDEIIRAMFKLMPDQRYSQDLNYGEVPVGELLEEVYQDCRPFVEQRAQRLIIEGAEGIKSIQADRQKLRDVLENLVLNAIKFTPDGGVVRIRAGRQLGGYLSIAVRDQGPGIPQSDLPHIFEAFYSGGDVLRHSSGRTGYAKRGMGLGLAIVRHFVELHGGSVSVSSGPDGTVFTVTVPIERPPYSHRPDRPDAPKSRST